jgi:ubiquinone/menaquinone biosynthesis C-methylase UbiE
MDKLAWKYRGTVADQYDLVRTGEKKWAREQKVMSVLLASMPSGTQVIDVPVGTGRLLEFYKQYGHVVTGVDVSPDMLREAGNKAADLRLEVKLAEGDIRHLLGKSNEYDVAVCLRLLNLIDMPTFRLAIRELARVSRSVVIVGVRHAVPLPELFASRTGFVRGLRQQHKRVRRWYEKRGMFLHHRHDVLAQFEEIGLVTLMSSNIESSSDGSEYIIYRLEKRQHSAGA